MAHPSQSGLPFLVRRSDSAKFADWHVSPEDVVPHFVGNIDLLFGDLGFQQGADDARRFMLALDACGHNYVIGVAHAVKLQFVHRYRQTFEGCRTLLELAGAELIAVKAAFSGVRD